MKYSSLKANEEKRLHIAVPKMGLDVSDSPFYIDPLCVSDCKNMYYDEGVLKTRPGISSDYYKILQGDFTDDYSYSSCFVTHTDVYIEDICYRIAVENTEVDMSEYYTSVFFIGPDREIVPAGHLHFSRISDDTFYFPTNITFFQAAPKNGGGIFAFVTCSNMENYSEKSYRIYEIDASFENWKQITDYYVPTVYVNGRGNDFEKAEATNQAFTGTPMEPEAPNLLNGIFYAYFSSDGYSSNFTLPFSQLSDETVSCRIYYSPTSYMDWVAGTGVSSVKKTFMSVEVTMNVDRSKGLIYFTTGNSDYAVPIMSRYRANNIRITATKRDENDFGSVVSCSCCGILDSRIILSGGIDNNRIFSARSDNPLYFPSKEKIEIGESELPVTALIVQAGNLIAFKRKGIYRMKLKKGDAINTHSLLADNASVFYETDSFDITQMSDTLGCIKRNAITNKDGKNIWVGSDSNIYMLTDSMSIKKLSDKVEEYLHRIPEYMLEEAVALTGKKGCLFFFCNMALLAQLDSSSPDADKIAWYIWEFPEELQIAGGISGKTPVLMCVNNYTTYYLGILDGESDVLISRISEDYPSIEHNIQSCIETAHYAPEGVNKEKKLERIYLQFAAKGKSEVNINGKKVDFGGETISQDMRRITVIPEISGFRTVYINLKSDTSMSVGDIDIYYSKFT